MSLENFEQYVEKYSALGYLKIPEGLTKKTFAACLAGVHKGDFKHLLQDHQTIYNHWVKVNSERGFGYEEEYLDGKPAEKLGLFGTNANFNGSQEWYKQYLDDDAEVLGASAAAGDA